MVIFRGDKLYFDDLGSIRPNNVVNGTMVDWAAGVSSPPDNWALYGAGASIAREETIIKNGIYSAKITSVGAEASLVQDASLLEGITYWKGKESTLGEWVYAEAANSVRIGISDGITTEYSSYHTGDSTWQWLVVSIVNISTSATVLNVINYVNTVAPAVNASAYFYGAYCKESGVGIKHDEGFDYDTQGSLITGASVIDLVEQKYYALEVLDVIITSKMALFEDYSDFVDLMTLVPLKFRNSVLLQELLSECGILTGTWLGNTNDIEKLVDKYNVAGEYLQYLSDLVGYSIIRADTATTSEQRRQLIQVIDWYKEKGTYVSLKHIAYTLGLNLHIWDTYTSDYLTFTRKDWFVGHENENPGGLSSTYYKSPHLIVEILLDTLYHSTPYDYLFVEEMQSNLIEYVEPIRPINVVVNYSMLLTSIAIEIGTAYITPTLISTTTMAAWEYSKVYFDGAFGPTGVSTNFNDNKFFDNDPTTFISSVVTWKLGNGSKEKYPDRDSFVLENVVLTGTVDSYNIYDDRIEFDFFVPIGTAQAGISELGLFLPDNTTMVVASTFPDIELTTDGPQLTVKVKIYRESSLDILVSFTGTDHLGDVNEMWLGENIQQEWQNRYDVTYNKLCANGKTSNRWDAWNMSWEEAIAGSYSYDNPVAVEDYYFVASIIDFGPYYSGLIITSILHFDEYLGYFITEIRTSPDAVNWTSWNSFTIGFVADRFIQIRGVVTALDPNSSMLYYDSSVFIAVPLT